MSAPEPDPWAEGNYGPPADPLPPALADSIASRATAAEYEAEWADNWDSADSHAYMDRVEAGLEPDPDEPVPFTLTGQAEAALDAAEPEPEAEPWKSYIDAAEAHDCPGLECHAYPTFDDDPARWGFLPEPEMTEAELAAAALAEAWGGQEPSASYAAWVAEGQAPEPEAEP